MKTPTLKDIRAGEYLVVVSVSGGKDSTATCLHMKELGVTDYRRVFADTGWEHNWTYEYIRGPLTRVLGTIDEVQGRYGGMESLILKKGMFPSRLRRFCTEELKVRPINDYIKALQDAGHEVINAVGIRADESKSRSEMAEWEWNESLDCWVWRPLIKWSVEDVVAIHQRHDLKPNPLYTTVVAGQSSLRVGCHPCIFARKAEIRGVATLSPERIDQIRDLEAKVLEAAKARYAARGETLESLNYTPPTFFHGKLSREGKPFPIDTIVAWSNTARGGKEELVVHEDEQPEGCSRWGFCEKSPSVLEDE